MCPAPEYDPIGLNLPVFPDGKDLDVKPVVIELSPEEIAVMYRVQKMGPREFIQELLRRFRAAGVPVEGKLNLKLAHGALARVKGDVGRFRYMWLPGAYVRGIEQWQKLVNR